ncbi:tautomerase family protein [Actinomycetospora endophytica]|uniref:Tautomerase family protein n=1 Tax=Actinomycetospora endophytica TaxID=2291215 RepID=A0ABS8P215_9PSEU|nr:tautomerase family protein [Actinomycetospora endophytica]MCD2192103.1 tautomerase family protein [Actinomycetospora endophytica]
MPFYQFTAPRGGKTLQHKAEIAAAVTTVHAEVTGAPTAYVHCSFTETAEESIFVAGEAVTSPRMVGLIREGRSPEVRARLLHGIADAWSGITGDAKESLAIFLVEMPGANAMEDGVVLPEITADVGAIM